MLIETVMGMLASQFTTFFFCFEIAPQSCLPNTDNSANSNLRKKEDEVGRPIHVFPRVSFSLLSAVV
jgi:hypothetical protein